MARTLQAITAMLLLLMVLVGGWVGIASAGGVMMMGGGVPEEAGSCSTQTVTISNTNGSSETSIIAQGQGIGQTITVSGGPVDVYSVSFNVASYGTGTTSDYEIRIASSIANFGSYAGSVTGTLSGTGVFEAVFATPVTLTNGTWIIGIYENTSSNHFAIVRDGNASYAGGTLYNLWGSGKWATSGEIDTEQDTYFTVKTCD